MIVIFYNEDKETIYVCSETEPTKVISINDPDIMDHIPNDDILYVQSAHFITKKQFKTWLKGDMELEIKQTQLSESQESTQHSGRLYIHPAHNGTILIEDISTRRYPRGIQLNGKWDFIAVDDIGEDILKESNHFRILKQKGKIEVVDGNYVKRNEHKIKMKVSPAEAALDAILVPPDVKAHAAASGVGTRSSRGSMLNDGAIEIMVD